MQDLIDLGDMLYNSFLFLRYKASSFQLRILPLVYFFNVGHVVLALPIIVGT